MKISAWVTVSDLVSTRQTLIEKALDLIDKKRSMFHKLPHQFIFKSLKQSGVDGLELLIPLYTSDINLKEVKKIVSINNIPVLSIHQSLTSLTGITLNEITRLCTIANTFSAKVITLHSGSLGKRLFNTDFTDQLKKLQQKHSVSFGIENMQQFPFPFPNPSYTFKGSELALQVQKTDLFITLDTTHLAQVGEDITQFYLNNKEKIVNIHCSDYKRS